MDEIRSRHRLDPRGSLDKPLPMLNQQPMLRRGRERRYRWDDVRGEYLEIENVSCDTSWQIAYVDLLGARNDSNSRRTR
jgi:hypothetical protein